VTCRNTFIPTTAAGQSFNIGTKTLSIPKRLELRDDILLWGQPDPEHDRRVHVTVSRPLNDFVKLQNSDDAGILAFAKRYGPLALCSAHELPVMHSIRGFWLRGERIAVRAGDRSRFS
jgi:hypothetical protein